MNIFSPLKSLMRLLAIFILGVICGAAGVLWFLEPQSEPPSTDHSLVVTIPLNDTIVEHAEQNINESDGPHSQVFYKEFFLPEDVAVTSIDIDVKNAPPEIIHHINIANANFSGEICGGAGDSHVNAKEYFVVSRNNLHSDFIVPGPYAIHIDGGDRVGVQVMTHVVPPPHGPGGNYDDVSVVLTLEYTQQSERPRAIEFIRLRHDDTPCAEPAMHQAYTVPAETEMYVRTSDTSVSNGEWYQFETAGTVISGSANVWGPKGGKEVRVFLNDTYIDTFIARQGIEPWQWYIDVDHDPYEVTAGDVITFSSTYTNSTDVPVADATGMYGFYFAPY